MTRKTPKKRRKIRQSGSSLIHAVEWYGKTGVKKRDIWKMCGFNDALSFLAEYSKALEEKAIEDKAHKAKAAQAEAERRRALEQINARWETTQEAPDIKKARVAAQRRLADGKALTQEEINALPEFQRRALQKSLELLPRRRSQKNKIKGKPDRPSASLVQSIVRRPRLTGDELRQAVLSLADHKLAEVNIAMKCGYKSEEIGMFRRALAKSLGREIAPLSRLLTDARGCR